MPQEEKKTGATNTAFNKAQAAKNDEFYTRRESIEDELQHYHPHFAGKTVYCNCDDPTISEFHRYFRRNFGFLKLKRLLTTCYKNQKQDMFTKNEDKQAVHLEYDGGEEKPPVLLQGDGDFRSDECVDLLRQADIVVTNPPFSLFREYVAQLVAEDKKFLIIGNYGAVIYKEIFRLIMAGKLWLGVKHRTMEFTKPDGSLVKSRNVFWFTNIDHQQRHEELRLAAKYKGNESDYPKYDNYDAIEVDKVAKIPRDYAGVMGVPITFLEKWNPEQFEILGNSRWHDGSWITDDINYVNGKQKYLRLLIKNRRPQ